MVDTTKLRMALGLPETLAELTATLMQDELVPMDHGGKPDNLRVAINRLRKALDPHGITVQSQRRLGYWISDDAKEKLVRLCSGPHSGEGGHHDGEGTDAAPRIDIMEGYDG